MSPAAVLNSYAGQFSYFNYRSTYYDCYFYNVMNSSSSNSNYGFRNSYDSSNETNTILGFDSPFVAASGNPGGVSGGGSVSNLSRPRLMKMRRQTSQNPRSTAAGAFGNRRGEEVDPGLGFYPFRASSESVFGKSNPPNRSFSFGEGNSNNLSSNSGSQTEIPGVVFDDFRKMQIDSEKQTDAIGANAAFSFKVSHSENKNGFSESMADQLPNEVSKLNIGDRDSGKSSVKLGNMNNFQDLNSMKIRFTNPLRNNVEADLEHEMYKMNLGNPHKTFVFGRNSKSDEHLVGKPESVNHGKQYNEEKIEADLISDKMKEMKVSGYQDDKSKIFVFGLNNKQQNQDEMKDDLISDKMQELKVGEDEKSSGFSMVFDNKKSVFDNQNVEPKVYETTSSTQFQPFGNASFSSKPEKNVEFIFSSKSDNFAGPNIEMKSIPESRIKKKKGKIQKPVIGQPRVNQDFIFGQKTSLEIPDSFEAYSPMDVSPYNETLADNYSKTSMTSSDDVTSDINSVTSESPVINSNITTDEDLVFATQRLNVHDSDLKPEVSETETFKSAMENMEFSNDSFATALDSDLSSTATSGSQEKTGNRLFKFGSKLENINNSNFTFAASTSSQGQLSPDTRQHKKKHRLKTSQDSYASSSILSPVRTQKGDNSTLLNNNDMDNYNYKPMNEQDSKIGTFSTASVSIAAEEACEKWRLRGNQAYGNGDLAKAEDYYTQGLNYVCETEKSKGCLRALMLCYSNRAATRISLGKMKDALKDCLMAAAIDPNFLKVQVRAAYCYLAIGEVEKATVEYMKCLQSGNEVCVDRKLLVEASQGLEKAQKVRECLKQYTELPRETYTDYENGLKVIDEALQISSYSEQLLQMKADTLLMLRKYEQIIHMCEETMNFVQTETPTSSSSSSWRSNLIVKSYFYLGRLEEAHQFIKKQENSAQITERLESMSLDSVIPLADTIQELLSHKAAGNEAYKGGKYTEAVEHYSCAISCSIESRPFAAICFCNRAAAYRGLGQITDAIADCSLAIALHPTYLKAISRRAGLYEMIRDYGQAAVDLQRLLTSSSQMEENGSRQTRVQLYNVEQQSRKEIPLNMYLILGVESTAAASEIKKAYRKAALKHHPDKAAVLVSRNDNGDDGVWKEIAENVHKDADRLFKMIGEAYAVLSNPSKRSEYDMDEEMRNEIKNYTKSPIFEPSGSRRWQDPWRPHVNPQSKGQENATSSSHRYYSRYS